jgi:glycosyltransferase involved in cell wall biosynthesis
MKITHVVDSMEVGGAETVIALLCRQHRMQGHEPSVACLYSVGPIGAKLQNEGFEVNLHHPSTPIGLTSSLYRMLRRNQPDVVHCHNATAAIIAAVPAYMAGVKTIIVTRHGLVSRPYNRGRELKFAIASRFCQTIVAVCDEARRNLIAAPFAAKAKIVRIYNGVPSVKRDRHSPRPSKGFTLLHVARLSAVKNQESLIRAFARAKHQVPDVNLWIVGKGPLELKLRTLTRELGVEASTQFFGEVSDLDPIYNAADLFVMSSSSEGLPMSLLEAMSAGLPSIVTNVGGMAEVASLSGAAVVVPPLSCEALADAICRAATDSKGLCQWRAAARKCYEQNFTLERMARDYIEVYENGNTISLTNNSPPFIAGGVPESKL